jgi:Cu-Zn family superoxide dismutase
MPRYALLVAIGLLATVATGAEAQETAKANVKDAQGKSLGEVTLMQHPQGVLIRAELSGLPPGWHGLHVHEVGKCDPPDFKSAGGHFNPGGHKHGYHQNGPHAGDLPNIHAGADGRAVVEHFTDLLRLGDAGAATARSAVSTSAVGGVVTVITSGATSAPGNVLDQDGSSVVVHAKADDCRTDPAGDSGDRIACGVVEKAG